MKTFHTMILAVTGLGCCAGLYTANAAPVDAAIQFPKKKPLMLSVSGAEEGGIFLYGQQGSEQIMKAKLESCDTFFLQTPADYATAMKLYRAGDIAEALPRLAAVRAKYKALIGLPFNPSTGAAMYELMAAIRLQDWATVQKRAPHAPKATMLTPSEARFFACAALLACDDAGAAAKMPEIEAFFAESKTINQLDLSTYGLARYAQARAYAAKVPAAELEAGVLSKEAAANASLAADYFCQAAVAQHGANPELIRNCYVRAAKLLWAMPGVKDYLPKLEGATALAANWKKAPADLKDAVVLAYMASGLYPVKKEDDAIASMKKLYFNTAKKASN